MAVGLMAVAISGLSSRSYGAPAVMPEIQIDTAIFMREAIELQELIVNPKKEKYSKRDNPAVTLMERVRNNQQKGDPRKEATYSFDQYDKTTIGLLDITDEQLDKLSFLHDYVDSTRYGSRRVLNILLNQKESTRLFSNRGRSQKTVVSGQSSAGIAEMFEQDNLSVVLDNLLKEADIYSNDITLMSNKFPSPLSSIGADYYKYFITDTLDVDGTPCIQLTFSPRSPQSFAFSGDLYVALDDTTGFIKRVSMRVPRTVNLNYIDNLHIDQVFMKDSLGKRHKIEDELNLDICIVKGTQRFFGHRKSEYSNFSYSKRNDLEFAYDMDVSEIILQGGDDKIGKFDEMRNASLTKAEWNMDTFMPRLREIPFFYWTEKALMILVDGYVKTGKPSRFDIGPINTLISTNQVEGVRFRLGGMTTAHLSPYLFAKGYVAYGTRDRKFKYKGELEYSFMKKKYHSNEYPVNSIKATYMYDVDMIGQHYLFTNADNIFLSWKRIPNHLMTYRRMGRLEYNAELPHNVSIGVWGEHATQEATHWLTFTNGFGESFKKYGRTSFGIRLRYAPGEKYIQEKNTRFRLNPEIPVIQFSQELGTRRLPGASFTTCRSELSIDKRFWFSAFGYLDLLLKGGIIWSQVPYPELMWPNANLSYTIQPESYSLMNPMEFALDRYASVDLTYWGNGVLFNRIPYVRQLKLREVLGFKGLVGRLSDKNNPSYHPSLYRFPTDIHTRLMGSDPYMELSVGIDNIFTVLRIDYVWRLTYRNVPGTDRSGLRVALHFNF